MDLSVLALPQAGWATAASLAVAFALLVWHARRADKARRAKEVEDAENDYREAVACRNPDAMRIAGRRLRRARQLNGEADPAVDLSLP